MSKIEVDAIDKQSGSTLTLGGSGTAVTLACGATQSGFGRTGTVDWQTSIKTSTITAVNGEGYFVNTTGGAITANLPAGVVGAIVSFKDYAQTFDTNALTIAANGSEKIEGQTFDLKLNTEGLGVTLVYGDATKGWQAVNSNEIVNVQKFVTATGGTVTCSGDFKIHTFTGPGTFSVSCAGNAQGSDTVSYTVIAGGGGGGGSNAPPGSPYGAGGGGGAGGFRESKSPVDSYTASPLATTAGLPVNSQSYPITVGAAGSAGPAFDRGGNGNSSTSSTITAAGGGGGGSRNIPTGPGLNGGSGGGGGSSQPSPAPSPTNAGGLGNTPSTTPAQGFPGGVGSNAPYCANGANAGGGGGATAVGVSAVQAKGGNGGAGATTSINATPTARAGGGGGGAYICGSSGTAGSGTGGTGGGAPGGQSAGSTSSEPGSAATVNTGGGGGGGSTTGPDNGPSTGGAGGSGIVIIRYKFQ